MGGSGDGNHHKGKVPPDKGKGKVPPDKGKGSGSGQVIMGSVTEGAACVVLRACVETFGPAGDAELNFNVKWPGTTLAAASDSSPDAGSSSDESGTGIDEDGNLHLPATFPVPPNRD